MRIFASIIDELSVKCDVPPFGKVWVSYYLNHIFNLTNFLVKVKEKDYLSALFSEMISCQALRAT